MDFANGEKGEKMTEWVVSDEDLGCDGAYYSYKEIVRCEKCRNWDRVEEYCIDFLTQDKNGFCSWAERREDDHTNE